MEKVTLIVGEQGVGKSTLARILASSDEVNFLNKDVGVFDYFDPKDLKKIHDLDEAFICLQEMPTAAFANYFPCPVYVLQLSKLEKP